MVAHFVGVNQQKHFQHQQQQYQPQQQQYNPQVQQVQGQQQQQQLQPQSVESLQESLKQSLQNYLHQQFQSVQQTQPIQNYHQGVQVPQSDKFYQPSVRDRQYQIITPSYSQFQQRVCPVQSQSQEQHFPSFRRNQPVLSNRQQLAERSFLTQRPQQFSAELSRSSQQFQPSPQVRVYDQINTAFNNGRHFSPHQSQFPQTQIRPPTKPPQKRQQPRRSTSTNHIP